MKKIIWVILVLVWIDTPCLADIESSSLFSIEGTKWIAISLDGTSPERYYGFFEGKVCELLETNTSCYDNIHPLYDRLPLVSFFRITVLPQNTDLPKIQSTGFQIEVQEGMLNILGLGLVMRYCLYTGDREFYSLEDVSFMIKVEDNWTSSGVE